MKPFLLAAFFFASTAWLARADDLAVMKIQFGKEKELKTVVIELYEDAAPRTVENFKELARKGFYKNIEFHRAFPGILVQTGDPLSTRRRRSEVGTGGPGYTLPAEINRRTGTGTLVTGRLPDDINPARRSSGSQFFVTLKPMPEYDGQYTVFGEVIGGLDTLQAIAAEPTDSNDYPVKRIRIRSLRLEPRGQVPVVPPAESPN